MPKALMLDFGGVIVESVKATSWTDHVADRMFALPGVEVLPSRERVSEDLWAGNEAAKQWRNAMSRPFYPTELSYQDYALDFICADWSAEARSWMRLHASRIALWVNRYAEERTLRSGMVELLNWCQQAEVPVVIVSNALSGEVHREFLAEHGLSHYFLAELYSDELGIRKPNPDFLLSGATAAGVKIEDTWYVGDHYDRDVLAGRRAGVGTCVLMRASGTGVRPYYSGLEPDLLVKNPVELLENLQSLQR